MTNPLGARSAPLQLSAWLAHWNAAGLESLEKNAAKLSRVYPVWYNLGDEGLAARRPEATAAQRQKVKDIASAHGLEVWALTSNFNERSHEWDAARMRRVMGSARTLRSHVGQLIDLAKADGAQGLDFDYECLAPCDRGPFTAFMAEASALCRAAGLKVGLPVHAKDSEPGEPSGGAAQDYAGLGKHVDSLQLMVYDYHWSTSDAGPIAPPDWASRVVKHALSLVPRERLEFGFPVYGNDWLGRTSRPLGWKEWEKLVAERGPAKRDPQTAELTLRYDGREAWFCDSVSWLRKWEAARLGGISALAFWVLGSEDPRLWDMLEEIP